MLVANPNFKRKQFNSFRNAGLGLLGDSNINVTTMWTKEGGFGTPGNYNATSQATQLALQTAQAIASGNLPANYGNTPNYVAPTLLQASSCLDAMGTPSSTECVDKNLAIEATNLKAIQNANNSVYLTDCLSTFPPRTDCYAVYGAGGMNTGGGYNNMSAVAPVTPQAPTSVQKQVSQQVNAGSNPTGSGPSFIGMMENDLGGDVSIAGYQIPVWAIGLVVVGGIGLVAMGGKH